MRSITHLALAVILGLIIHTSGLAQDLCYCDFDKHTGEDSYATVSIFSTNQDTYGHIGDLQYKVVNRDASQEDNTYQIEVRIGRKTYSYQVDQLRLYYDGLDLGYMSNLRIGLMKIVSQRFQQCPQAAQANSAQLELLFNAD
ncbi:hypothetical protein WJR50_24065 [Catalinimonas sp. 4WD22]|uniref:hypothetical protein n=1 Tax=Catalinimonas locisalis TaxID=3133978 RepID=UPI0031015EEF